MPEYSRTTSRPRTSSHPFLRLSTLLLASGSSLRNPVFGLRDPLCCREIILVPLLIHACRIGLDVFRRGSIFDQLCGASRFLLFTVDAGHTWTVSPISRLPCPPSSYTSSFLTMQSPFFYKRCLARLFSGVRRRRRTSFSTGIPARLVLLSIDGETVDLSPPSRRPPPTSTHSLLFYFSL